MLNEFPLKKTSLKIIYGNENNNDINKSFSMVRIAMRFVPKDRSEFKY